MKNKILLIAALILTLIGIVLIFGGSWVENLAKSKIDKIEGISYDSLSIEVENEYLILKNFKINNPAFKAEVDNFEVQGISLYALIINNHIKISEVDLEGVEITYRSDKQATKNKKRSKKNLPKFTISSISINDGYILIEKNKKLLIRSSFESNLIDLNSESVKSSSKILSDVSNINFKNFEYHTPDSLYVIYIDDLKHNENKLAVIKDLRAVCNYDKYELGQVVGHELDWMSADLDSIVIESSSFHKLILNKEARKVSAFGLNLSLFRDKRLPFPENQRPRLVKEMLSDTSLSFEIDTISIKESSITYEEQVADETKPGIIRFEAINGDISNFSSYTRKVENPPHAVLSTKIMGRNVLYADISFPLSINEPTLVKGALNSTDLKLFNPMLSNVTGARIKDGHLNKLDFEFSYIKDISEGTMNFTYENFAVEFTEASGKNGKSNDFNLFNDIKSFLANALVLKKNNDKGDNNYNEGKIYFERDKKKSMFNFWWKSILSGFKSSVGLTSENKSS